MSNVTTNSIVITATSVDGEPKTRRYSSLSPKAIAFAHAMVGESPEVGSNYAVSGDGVSKITIEGASIRDLFPEDGTESEAEGIHAPCLCGCTGTPTGKKAIFIPGHDARLKGYLIRQAKGAELKSDPIPTAEQAAYGVWKWSHLVPFTADQKKLAATHK